MSSRTGSVPVKHQTLRFSGLLELLMVISALCSRCLEQLGLWARKARGVVFQSRARGAPALKKPLGLSQEGSASKNSYEMCAIVVGTHASRRSQGL